MRAAAALAMALAASAVAPGATPQSGCPFHGPRNFARKADLPHGGLAALGFPMAERGAPFQVSDAIGPGPRLPSSRFVSARLDGCTLAIRYEHGGIAHTFETAIVERRGNDWALVRGR